MKKETKLGVGELAKIIIIFMGVLMGMNYGIWGICGGLILGSILGVGVQMVIYSAILVK